MSLQSRIWTSEDLRIYTVECENQKNMDDIENCSLDNYKFGDDLMDKYNNRTESDVKSERECTNICANNSNCTFSSWSQSDKQCQLLGSVNYPKYPRRDNPPFFCQTFGSKITEKEVICKPVSQVIHESQGELL